MADDGLSVRRCGLHEDVVATVIGLAIVALALAVTWSARPADSPGSRETWPKGWPTPLSQTIDKPQTWSDSPLAAFRDKKANLLAVPIVLGGAWVVAVAIAGAALGGRSIAPMLGGAIALALLAGMAFLLAAQKVIHFYNLEYPLWALMLGILIGNVVGMPVWLERSLAGEFLIKTGLVVFGAEVLFSRLLELGLPGLLTSWVVTPIVR